MTRAVAWLAALALVLALASCGGGGGGGSGSSTKADTTPLSIGTKNFTESEILGELYKQALEAKGIRVDLQSAVGPTEIISEALRQGLVDMYPEYVGTLLSVVDKIERPPADPHAAYLLAKQIAERSHLTLLAPARLNDENALAVTRAFSRRHHVVSIGDLRHLHPAARLGSPPEFLTRFEGMIGLRARYGLTGLRKDLVDPDTDLRYAALDSGKIDVAAVFTTDSQLADGRYTVLADPKGLFDQQHVAPLISQKALAAHGPVLARTLNAVSALLTTPLMRMLNRKADVDKQTPSQIADAFLRAHGLK